MKINVNVGMGTEGTGDKEELTVEKSGRDLVSNLGKCNIGTGTRRIK